VVLVVDGPAPDGVVRRAAEFALSTVDDKPKLVAVVAVARILGSGLGVPHPGLLPTPAERQERVRAVEQAIAALRRYGVSADGQVAVTRRPGRTVGRIARVRQAGVVVLAEPVRTGGRLRRLLEGDLTRDVRRWTRLPVEVVPAVVAARP
jgi:hypothetical protein